MENSIENRPEPKIETIKMPNGDEVSFCPLTTQVKGYPCEVLLPPGLKATGSTLADQIKSLDWRVRKTKRST